MADIRDSYQIPLENAIYDRWNHGCRNVLAIMPTGAGKSVVVRRVARKKHLLGSVQVKVAHRNELVGQLSLHMAHEGIRHRIIAPKPTIAAITAEHRKEFNRSFVDPNSNCSVAGVDTLIARKEELKGWSEQVDHWTIDEAHHVLRANKWGKAVDMFPNAVGLGVTASPLRADGMGLGAHHDGVFHDMILGPTMRELIDMGALCEYQIVLPKHDIQIDESDFDKNGELSPAKGRKLSKENKLVGDVVTEYIAHAYGKRGICFATDVETAGEIAQRFNEIGIPAAAVSAKTPFDVRNEYIKRFKAGLIWMLINVDLFGEGFDVPAVEVVIMARPTGSLAVYLQQFGRALRVLAGKLYGLVIDHVSNWKRHGFPDKYHPWSLDRRDKKAKKEPDPEEIELIGCRSCSRPYERCLPACPYCGATQPLPEPASRTLQRVDGDMTLLTAEMCAQMRAMTQLETPASIGERVAFAAGRAAGQAAVDRQIAKYAAQERLSNAFAQWAAIQRLKGRSDAESHKRIYLTLGMSMYDALADKQVSEFEALATTVEGWCVL